MRINAKTKICCIIGNPVEHSKSPEMHNAAFNKLGLNYVFTAIRVTDVKKAIEAFRALNFAAVVVTVPHKTEVMKYVDDVEETAQKIGAINIIVNKDGMLKASNTDWIGAVESLKEHTALNGKKVAVLGAGGAARAVVYGLIKENAEVSIFNRTIENAQKLADDFKLKDVYQINQTDKFSKAYIIINTTSVGMEPNEFDSPIPIDFIQPNQVIFDIVYTPKETALLKNPALPEKA